MTEQLTGDGVCKGGGVAVNGANVMPVSAPSVMPAPVAVTTFPLHQQQPTLVDPNLLQQYSGNTYIHSFIPCTTHLSSTPSLHQSLMLTHHNHHYHRDIYTSLFTKMVAHKKKIQTYKQAV